MPAWARYLIGLHSLVILFYGCLYLAMTQPPPWAYLLVVAWSLYVGCFGVAGILGALTPLLLVEVAGRRSEVWDGSGLGVLALLMLPAVLVWFSWNVLRPRLIRGPRVTKAME